MALGTKRVAIGGTQYSITQLGAVAGRGLFKKFVTAMGPLLRDAFSGSMISDVQKLIAGLDDKASVNDLVLAAVPIVGPTFVRAVEDLPQELFEELCEAFTATTEVLTGTPAIFMPLGNVFDEHFAGDYLGLMGWFGRCLMVNGFLANSGGAKSATPKAPAAAATS